MDADLIPDVVSEGLLPAVINFTCDAATLNPIKSEFSLSEPLLFGGFVEHAVVKHTDTSIKSLDLKLKSEAPDLKCDIVGGNNDIYIKLEQVMSEEVHIKTEIDDSLVEQTDVHLSYHTSVKHFQCNTCYYNFMRNCDLRRHLKIHTGEKPLKCSVCDYRCRQKSDLQRHIDTHTGVKPFQCSVCDYRCLLKSNLKTHMKIHGYDFTCKPKPITCKTITCKTFTCDVCDYTCIIKDNFQKHVKIHTAEKPFKCGVCDYRCFEKCDLQKHVKIHTGEKPFRCTLCDYRCIRKNHLKNHMKAHTQCSICNSNFRNRNTLRKHMKTHIVDS